MPAFVLGVLAGNACAPVDRPRQELLELRVPVADPTASGGYLLQRVDCGRWTTVEIWATSSNGDDVSVYGLDSSTCEDVEVLVFVGDEELGTRFLSSELGREGRSHQLRLISGWADCAVAMPHASTRSLAIVMDTDGVQARRIADPFTRAQQRRVEAHSQRLEARARECRERWRPGEPVAVDR